MKAISVRQPWAWGIIYSIKNIENRGWPINYRGDILIHAAKKCTKKEYEIVSIFFQRMGVSIGRVEVCITASPLPFGTV
ncbi:ASCH domain-containing protein, partial [uncultured Nostoc sp.]